jgi:hypothetical protein
MNSTWSKYNKSLINRGSINFWFSKESCKKWKAKNSKKFGRPFIFSDDWIKALLVLRFVFKLPLRQLQGFATSLLDMQKISAIIPHYSCICKRAKNMANTLPKKKVTDIVFDTSGVRIYESGEWKKEKYGCHRKWRKLHVAIDLKTKEIIYSKLTSASKHDLSQIDEVMLCLNRRKGKVLIDGIADQHELYRKCEEYNKQLLTPPRKGSIMNESNETRNDAIKIIRALGGDLEAKSLWGKLTGYNQRSQIETLFSRWKRILGETLKSKLESTTTNEVYIKSLIMNRMMKSLYS